MNKHKANAGAWLAPAMSLASVVSVVSVVSLAAAGALLAASASSYAQQPLSLSYKLDVGGQSDHKPAPQINRCTGFRWVTALGACGRELLSRMGPAEERVAHVEPALHSEPAAVPGALAATRSSALAVAGRRAGRSDADGDTVIGSSGAADLLFRVGSGRRMRNNEERGWDAARFNDTAYQTYLENKGYKAVALELHVPFQ